MLLEHKIIKSQFAPLSKIKLNFRYRIRNTLFYIHSPIHYKVFKQANIYWVLRRNPSSFIWNTNTQFPNRIFLKVCSRDFLTHPPTILLLPLFEDSWWRSLNHFEIQKIMWIKTHGDKLLLNTLPSEKKSRVEL